jgi:hypothetical protein
VQTDLWPVAIIGNRMLAECKLDKLAAKCNRLAELPMQHWLHYGFEDTWNEAKPKLKRAERRKVRKKNPPERVPTSGRSWLDSLCSDIERVNASKV